MASLSQVKVESLVQLPLVPFLIDTYHKLYMSAYVMAINKHNLIKFTHSFINSFMGLLTPRHSEINKTLNRALNRARV